MVTLVTLDPVAQSYGHPFWYADPALNPTAVVDDPVLVGGGSVSDGSDSSYVEMGTWEEGGGTTHMEPLFCDFALPGGYGNPTALAFKVRMRSDPDVAANPPDRTPDVFVLSLTAVSDGTQLGRCTNGAALSFDVLNAAMPTPTVRTFWFDDVDPANPTDSGNWFEFAVDADNPGTAEALTGAGVRASFAIFSGLDLDAVTGVAHRRPWLDVYEFQLLVSCEGGGIYPLRRYPSAGVSGPNRARRRLTRRPGNY